MNNIIDIEKLELHSFEDLNELKTYDDDFVDEPFYDKMTIDEKIAQINRSSDASIQINKQNNATAIALGKQQLTQALSKDSLMRKESYENRKIKEQKYKTLGMAAVALCFTLRYVSKTVMSGVKK